jgi:peptidyl-prolyl cis-trans isomerase D
MTLALTPETLARPDEIPDEDARKRYEELKKERFGTPEKRAVEQIFYTDSAEAAAARASLDAGANWDKLLADQKLTPANASLGTLPRDGIADKNVADAAFALQEGKVSAPIKTEFGTVLIRITKIEPANIKPFDTVSAEIKREMAVQRARGEIARLHDAIEDERASGKPLDEAARSAGHEARLIDAIDAKGTDPQGVPAADLADAAALLKAAYASDIGVDNDTLRLAGGGYQWFEVTKIEPAREKSFDEVRKEVEKAWRDDEAAKRLTAKTADLAKRLEAGESISAIASSEGGLEVKRLTGVKRGFNPEVAPNIAAQFFNVGVGGAGSVSQPDGGRLLFKVVDSSVPPFESTDPSLAALSTDIKSGMTEDVIAQYLTKLQNDLGVRINPKALAAATGASNNY